MLEAAGKIMNRMIELKRLEHGRDEEAHRTTPTTTASSRICSSSLFDMGGTQVQRGQSVCRNHHKSFGGGTDAVFNQSNLRQDLAVDNTVDAIVSSR